MTEFQIEITPEIFGLENQLRYFCKAGTSNNLTGSKIFNSELTCQDMGHLNKCTKSDETFSTV